jgi:hypothetical protein
MEGAGRRPRERSKTFPRKIDAERHILSTEDAKLRGAYVDPAAGRVPFGEWATRPQDGHHDADLYGHLFPDETERLAEQMDRARAVAVTGLSRTQRGPEVVQLREAAGQ